MAWKAHAAYQARANKGRQNARLFSYPSTSEVDIFNRIARGWRSLNKGRGILCRGVVLLCQSDLNGKVEARLFGLEMDLFD